MRAPEPAGRDGGHMLVELLVVIALMGIVGGLVSDAIISSFKGQRDITARAGDLDSLRQAMERTTRDMRSASDVLCAQAQLLTLKVPVSGALTWSVTTSGGASSLVQTAADPANPCATPTAAGTTVLSNLDAAGPLFSYAGRAGYTTTAAVDRTTCLVAGSTSTWETRCIGGINLDLEALLPGHPDLGLTETVQLRNVT